MGGYTNIYERINVYILEEKKLFKVVILLYD